MVPVEKRRGAVRSPALAISAAAKNVLVSVEGQGGEVEPVLLRDDLFEPLGAVPVHVDEARHDGLAGRVDDVGPVGDGDLGTRTDGDDAIALDEHGGVLEHAVLGIDGDHPGADEGHGAGGHVPLDAHAEAGHGDRRLGLLCLLGRLRGRGRRCTEEGEGIVERPCVEGVAEGPVESGAVTRPVQVLAGLLGDLLDGERLRARADRHGFAGEGERSHPGLEALGEGHPAAVRGDAPLEGCLAGEVLALAALGGRSGQADAA
jgi:hypothetical protein